MRKKTWEVEKCTIQRTKEVLFTVVTEIAGKSKRAKLLRSRKTGGIMASRKRGEEPYGQDHAPHPSLYPIKKIE